MNGNWGKWGSFGNCNKPCNGGTQVRIRYCNNPYPNHGGRGCVGSSLSSQSCNTQKCPGEFILSSFLVLSVSMRSLLPKEYGTLLV